MISLVRPEIIYLKIFGKFNVELIDTAGIRIHKTDQEGLDLKLIKLINDSNIILLI